MIFSIDSSLLSVKFPILILQPIVENSIKHGILKKIDGGIVTISVRDYGSEVYIEINDNGVGFENADRSRSTGLGLQNINNRLKLLYGEQYALNIVSSNNGSNINFYIKK